MDCVGQLPEDVWIRIASTLQSGADRSAFAQSCKAFASYEKASRQDIVVQSWTQVLRERELEASSSEARLSQLTAYLSQFPCMQTLQLVGLGSTSEDVKLLAEGFGRVIINHQVTRETLVSYEPAVAVSHFLKSGERVIAFGARSETLQLEQRHSLLFHDASMQKLARVLGSVRELTLRFCDGLSSSALGQLEEMKGLRTLHLVECSGILHFSLIKRLDQLESLKIQGLGPSTSTSLTDSAVQQIAECCTNLRTLELISHKHLTNNSLLAIGQNCRTLTDFKFLGCPSLQTDSQGIAALAALTNLQTLHLSDLEGEIDPAFQPISQQCTGLTDLSITDCPNFSRWALKRLCSHCTELRVLDLSRCKKLALYEALVDLKLCTNLEELTIDFLIKEEQSQLFQSFAESLKKLQRFCARGCKGLPESVPNNLFLRCKSLHTLILAHCGSIGGDILGCLPDLRSLTRLDMSGCRFAGRFEGLLMLGPCTNLTELSLACCSSLPLDNGAFREVFAFGMGERLQKLNLARNETWFTDATLEAVLEHCPALRELNIAGNSKLDGGLHRLLRCSSLKSLSISDCCNLRVPELLEFLRQKNGLKRVWANGIDNGVQFNSESIGSVLEGCKDLKRLALTTGRYETVVASSLCKVLRCVQLQ